MTVLLPVQQKQITTFSSPPPPAGNTMTDLTVLISPIPLYPETKDFTFGRRLHHPLNKPIMVTLEREIDEEADNANNQPTIDPDFINPPTYPPRRSRSPGIVDSNLLSPPINTWKSRPRHRPTRSQSAPPERRLQPQFVLEEFTPETSKTDDEVPLALLARGPKRGSTFTPGREPVRPPPPLLRPTTFWRRTRRSGVTGASYSPGSHLIRRSTYIAAGLAFDAPVHDLSALCVESRAMRLLNYSWPGKSFVLTLVFGAGYAISQPDTIPPSASHGSSHGVPRQIIIIPHLSTDNPIQSATSVANIPSTPSSVIIPTPLITTPSSPPILNSLTSISESIVASSNAVTGTSLQSSSTSTASTSSLVSATPGTVVSFPQPTIKLVDLIPAFSVIGVLLVGSLIWFTYGCCTRRPKMRRSNNDLIGGPRYVGVYSSDYNRDVEEGHGRLGYESKDPDVPEMKERHHRKGGRGQLNTEFRWPSIRRGERPGFDPIRGFHVPEEYLDEGDPLLSLPLAPMHAGQTRPTSTRVTKTKPGSNALHEAQGGVLSPPCSDTTSLALLELYESDDEAIAERRKKETPWESLRHKSIKRGIIENVIKETKWMDSIRGALSGRGGQGKSGEVGGFMAGAEDDVMTPPARAHTGMNKRRGHLRMNSDLCTDDSASTPWTLRVVNKQPTQFTDGAVSPTISESEWLKGNSPPRPQSESPMITPKGHRTFTWLKDEDSQDKFTPIPARLSQSPSRGRSRSRSRTRSTSPVKQRSPTVLRDGDLTERGRVPSRKDILPSSPSQIRSPPLESQICFTPIPTPIAKRQSSRALRPKIRTAASSTKGPIERRLHLTESPPLPSPDREGLLFDFQGNRLADSEDRDMVMIGGEDSFYTAVSVLPTSTTFQTEGETGEEVNESLMKKVEQIMETGWGMRELEREAVTRNGLGIHD